MEMVSATLIIALLVSIVARAAVVLALPTTILPKFCSLCGGSRRALDVSKSAEISSSGSGNGIDTADWRERIDNAKIHLDMLKSKIDTALRVCRERSYGTPYGTPYGKRFENADLPPNATRCTKENPQLYMKTTSRHLLDYGVLLRLMHETEQEYLAWAVAVDPHFGALANFVASTTTCALTPVGECVPAAATNAALTGEHIRFRWDVAVLEWMRYYVNSVEICLQNW